MNYFMNVTTSNGHFEAYVVDLPHALTILRSAAYGAQVAQGISCAIRSDTGESFSLGYSSSTVIGFTDTFSEMLALAGK